MKNAVSQLFTQLFVTLNYLIVAMIFALKMLNRKYLLIAILLLVAGTNSIGQSSSGVQWVPKFGLGMSRNFLVDVGLVAYNFIPDKSKAQYYDANLSVMVLIGRHTMAFPKLDLNASLFPIDPDELITFNLGGEAGVLIDFKQSTGMLSPKAGLAAATGLIRLYYHYNFLLSDFKDYPGMGRHAITLEVNISAFQGRGLKM